MSPEAELEACAMALGGHEAVKATESSAFCGSVCHEVHYPEYTTFQESPHSSVPCADCHIGAGLKNMIMAKVRGMKDIIPAMVGGFDRPLSTPLQNLRPASETCEECHWKEKFTDDIVRVKTTFNEDEKGSAKTDVRVLKVGGGKAEVASGIHWHSTSEVWYLPVDDQRLQIAWAGVKRDDGSLTEYVDPNLIDEVSPERINTEKRRMDCVDCHNRVTHLFRSPSQLMDTAIADGSIDRELPFIKRMGVAALDPPNLTLEEAYAKIDGLRDFYKSNYPQVFEDQSGEIYFAVAKLKEIARLTTFPERQVDWETYVNQLGHDKPNENMEVDWETLSTLDNSPGCFRCHGNLTLAESSVAGRRELGAASLNGTRDGLGSADGVVAPGILNTGSRPGNKLDANCKLCHYTKDSAPTSPLAPAVSHPIDGLDDCLVCHNQSGPKPFKTEHPWSNSKAYTACHQSAPAFKPLPAATSKPANEVAHTLKGLEDCLACHGPTGVRPVTSTHTGRTNSTCTLCHTRSW